MIRNSVAPRWPSLAKPTTSSSCMNPKLLKAGCSPTLANYDPPSRISTDALLTIRDARAGCQLAVRRDSQEWEPRNRETEKWRQRETGNRAFLRFPVSPVLRFFYGLTRTWIAEVCDFLRPAASLTVRVTVKSPGFRNLRRIVWPSASTWLPSRASKAHV